VSNANGRSRPRYVATAGRHASRLGLHLTVDAAQARQKFARLVAVDRADRAKQHADRQRAVALVDQTVDDSCSASGPGGDLDARPQGTQRTPTGDDRQERCARRRQTPETPCEEASRGQEQRDAVREQRRGAPEGRPKDRERRAQNARNGAGKNAHRVRPRSSGHS
jgi:hypothetical protein